MAVLSVELSSSRGNLGLPGLAIDFVTVQQLLLNESQFGLNRTHHANFARVTRSAAAVFSGAARLPAGCSYSPYPDVFIHVAGEYLNFNLLELHPESYLSFGQ
jgi:hypothetical protein